MFSDHHEKAGCAATLIIYSESNQIQFVVAPNQKQYGVANTVTNR